MLVSPRLRNITLLIIEYVSDCNNILPDFVQRILFATHIIMSYVQWSLGISKVVDSTKIWFELHLSDRKVKCNYQGPKTPYSMVW